MKHSYIMYWLIQYHFNYRKFYAFGVSLNPIILLPQIRIYKVVLYKEVSKLIGNFFDSVFAHDPKAPKEANMGFHVIETKSGNPHKDKVRRCPEKWRGDINEQINEMSKNGIIKESSSPYSSNIVLVNKKDGAKRFCVDYRTLNNSTVKDTYPLPKVDDLLEQTRGAKYFSQLDLAAGYWGIPIDPKDSKKTAFASHRGKFEFVRMPFGLCNAQATFQRIMDIGQSR